jgi:hypothetical protein
MLDIFVNMNLEMQKTGNLSASISKEELLKLVHARVHGMQNFMYTAWSTEFNKPPRSSRLSASTRSHAHSFTVCRWRRTTSS